MPALPASRTKESETARQRRRQASAKKRAVSRERSRFPILVVGERWEGKRTSMMDADDARHLLGEHWTQRIEERCEVVAECFA